jgi:putative ABC transport system substrate-binding protein
MFAFSSAISRQIGRPIACPSCVAPAVETSGKMMKLRILTRLLLAAVFLTASGWSANGWAQTRVPRVGMLSFDDSTQDSEWWGPFYRTLRNQGWIDGKSVAFGRANAHSDPSRYGEAAAELVRLQSDVIFADSAPAVRAAFAATRTIPIVGLDFTTDPVAEGYAESYGRPGKNVTGVFLDAPEFSGKWLELLKAMIPGLSRVVALWDPSPGDAHLRALRGIAPAFGLQLQVLEVRKPEDIDAAGSAFRAEPQALIILPSPMMYVESGRLAKLAMKHRMPATSMARQFAEAGGVLAYGPDQASAYERCGALVARILSGAKAAKLPIERPTQFTLVVNLKTAKALNLTMPDSVLARADQVIR